MRKCPIPDNEYEVFLSDTRISTLSCKLNLIFSFASLESTHTFPTPGPPSFLAICGRIYHSIRPGFSDNSAIRWMLYDGFDDSRVPHSDHARQLPQAWIHSFRDCLLRVNVFTSEIHSLHQLQLHNPGQYLSATLIIQDSGTPEIAAIMCYDNTTLSDVHPRTLSVSRVDGRHQNVSIISRM